MADNQTTIRTALISVYHKEGLSPLLKLLKEHNVQIISTGGTAKFIRNEGFEVTDAEQLTSYPSILDGRVKTLHPAIFGGILSRSRNRTDQDEMTKHGIMPIQLVIVDLYPFEETVESGAGHEDIIEKIDIGGIALIRAAAKNYQDVVIIPSREHYKYLEEKLSQEKFSFDTDERKLLAGEAFRISLHYDKNIGSYFSGGSAEAPAMPGMENGKPLRYGENPHQNGFFIGELEQALEQLSGKELSYNNLLDIDAAINLMNDLESGSFAVIKHNNPCGVATRANPEAAWKDALAGDPVSAFGGIIITNEKLTAALAEEIHNLFFEVLIAPDFDSGALDILKQKKNRILLKQKETAWPQSQFRSVLNGVLMQDKDIKTESISDLKNVTQKTATENEVADLIFANKIVKHAKSNAIVLVKNKQLVGIGVGQTSRVDALKQAIEKAANFDLKLKGAVMASDAFFPFPDCVQMANKAGITAVIQPGGSIRDEDSINYCNQHGLAMVVTGTRHFKH
ncbi:MAG: bifunctional phosphoribosylaminoimidazolecarboxamide formyltransferase/IMP cyclohydrolase [Bacteroidia bacterium]